MTPVKSSDGWKVYGSEVSVEALPEVDLYKRSDFCGALLSREWLS
jgi:hypothetical protein